MNEGWIWTTDHAIEGPVLYQLSYWLLLDYILCMKLFNKQQKFKPPLELPGTYILGFYLWI